MNVHLFTLPGWSQVAGSPHLAGPQLGAWLRMHGIDVTVRDLNLESALHYGIGIDAETAIDACAGVSLRRMNKPYLALEVRLRNIASQYGGEWSLQSGFLWSSRPDRSAVRAVEASRWVSPYSGYFEKDVVPATIAASPDVVALSVAGSAQLVPSLELARRLRCAGFRGKIVWGGNVISRIADAICRVELFEMIDCVMPFQGEEGLLEYCFQLVNGVRNPIVAGALWSDGWSIQRQGVCTSVDPNRLPTPDFEGLPIGKYPGVNYLVLSAGRGCYHGRCTFCAIPYGWGTTVYSVRRSSSTCADMASLLDRHGIPRFKFVDEAMPVSMISELATRLHEDRMPVSWEAYARLEPAWTKSEFATTAARGGLRKVYLGLETLPGEGRRSLGKGDYPEIGAIIRNCSQAGILVHLFCMVGCPGTTPEDARRTVAFLLENAASIDTADVTGWRLARHTDVPGVRARCRSGDDWALEFDHEPIASNVLRCEEIEELATGLREAVWREVPRLLHPTYRLVSPWVAATERVTSELSALSC